MKAFWITAVLAMVLIGLTPLATAHGVSLDGDAEARANAREERQETREELREERQQVVAARTDAVAALRTDVEKVKACRGDETDGCKNVRADARKNAVAVLQTHAEKMIEHLNTVRANVDASSMKEDIKAAMLASIDARITAITAAKASVDGLSDTSSAADIRAATKTLKESWQASKARVEESKTRVLNTRIGGIIKKMEKLDARLDSVIAKLSEKGADVSGAAELKTEFDAKLASAKVHYDEAIVAFGTPGAGTTDEAMRAAKEHIALAKEDLKAAHQLLKEIVAEVKEANPQVFADAEASTEAEASA